MNLHRENQRIIRIQDIFHLILTVKLINKYLRPFITDEYSTLLTKFDIVHRNTKRMFVQELFYVLLN